MANKDLNKAKAAKKDEFYTRLEDIELELKHYRHHFKGKAVLCNCDDPRCSKFFRYFYPFFVLIFCIVHVKFQNGLIAKTICCFLHFF